MYIGSVCPGLGDISIACWNRTEKKHVNVCRPFKPLGRKQCKLEAGTCFSYTITNPILGGHSVLGNMRACLNHM
jgi:hypothetical protein